jgi:hypothetical protein
MAHWKSFLDKEYLGCWDLPQDRTAEIVKVEAVKLEGVPSEGIKASRRPVIHFKGTTKKLIVNATIGKTIAGMYGPDVNQWLGKKITLYGTTTKSKGGGMVECVRVRPTVPKVEAAPIESQPVDEEMRKRQQEGAKEVVPVDGQA